MVMRYSTLFCDLDETLYPSKCGVWESIAVRIDDYMAGHLPLPREEIPALRTRLFIEYGTTLRGLKMEYKIDELDFLRYVHDIPLRKFLTPNPWLRQTLLSLPLRRVIFTNADVHHARRVLDVLGLDGCFERIIDVLDSAPYCKPQPEAYHRALESCGGLKPGECILIDDGRRNIATAREVGFYTIWVGQNGQGTDPNAHAHIHSIQELPQVLDPLLNGSRNREKG